MDGINKKLYQVIISEKATEMLIQHVRFVAKVSQAAADSLRIESNYRLKIFTGISGTQFLAWRPIVGRE